MQDTDALTAEARRTLEAQEAEQRETLAKRQKLIDMYEAGATVREMAKAFDVSTQSIYQQLDKLGLPAPSQRGEEAAS